MNKHIISKIGAFGDDALFNRQGAPEKNLSEWDDVARLKRIFWGNCETFLSINNQSILSIFKTDYGLGSDESFNLDFRSDPDYVGVVITKRQIEPIYLHKNSAEELSVYVETLKKASAPNSKGLSRQQYNLILVKIYQLIAERSAKIKQAADRIMAEMALHYDSAKPEEIRPKLGHYLELLEKDKMALEALSTREVEHVKKMIKLFHEKNELIASYLQLYPDPKDLFEFVFKKKPSGDIKVHQRSMMIAFECFDIEDYATVCSETEEKAKKSGGISNFYAGDQTNLNGVIAGVNSSGIKPNPKNGIILQEAFSKFENTLRNGILNHEWRHNMDRLFFGLPFYCPKVIERETAKPLGPLAIDVKNQRERELDFINSVKTEILANLEQGTSYTDIVKKLSSDLYDYWQNTSFPFSLEKRNEMREKHYRKLTEMIKIAYEIKDINLLAVVPPQNWARIHKIISKPQLKISEPLLCFPTDILPESLTIRGIEYRKGANFSYSELINSFNNLNAGNGLLGKVTIKKFQKNRPEQEESVN